MGNGIASWPSNSLFMPATASVIIIALSLSAAHWGKHCWQKDLQIMITLWIACCTRNRMQSIAYLATMCIIFPRILATVWTVLAHDIPNHQGCWPGAPCIPECFWDIARGRIHPLFYLLVSEWLIVAGSSPASHSVRFEPRNIQQVEPMLTGPVWLFVKVS